LILANCGGWVLGKKNSRANSRPRASPDRGSISEDEKDLFAKLHTAAWLLLDGRIRSDQTAAKSSHVEAPRERGFPQE